jgi:hypothetical protein
MLPSSAGKCELIPGWFKIKKKYKISYIEEQEQRLVGSGSRYCVRVDQHVYLWTVVSMILCQSGSTCLPVDCSFNELVQYTSNYVSPPLWWGDILFLSCPSVCLSVTQFVSATPLKLWNGISWNLVGSKDTICSCAYYQEILISWILWELCPFELRNFPKFTTEAACQHNSSETTEQNFMKLGR